MLPMHEGSRSLTNLDVWIEIIRHFRFHFLDDVSTRQTKKAALRTLSLVARQLAPLSQSEMWRTVSSTKHIARYIIKAEGSNVVGDGQAKFLRKPLDPKCRERALKILSYTRTFIFRLQSTDEQDLDWEFVLLAIGHSPLFVNLDTIIIDSNGGRKQSDINMFSMIASSPIKRVVYRYLTPDDNKSILLLHSNLRMHNAPVTSVEVLEGYHIAPSITPRILYTTAPGISLNLHSLIPLPFSQDLLSWFLALSKSPNLLNLRIVFNPPNKKQNAATGLPKGEKIQFANLQQLEIHTSYRQDFLSDLDCPSLISLSLHLSSIPSFSIISTSVAHFTQIENLSITISGKPPLFGSSDLQALINPLVSLRDLKILGVTSQLAENDVIELSTKITLHSLIISGPKSTPLPLSIFLSIAKPQSSRLETICLPINFSSIPSLPNSSSIWPTIPTLKNFIIWEGDNISDSMREKIKLTEFVHQVFPHARIDCLDEAQGTNGGKSVKDLEELRYYISCTSMSPDKKMLCSSSSEKT